MFFLGSVAVAETIPEREHAGSRSRFFHEALTESHPKLG
jgi:hypothetical protein